MKHLKIFLLILLLTFTISHQLFAEEIPFRHTSPQYVGIVTGNKVNIRSGPHESHEIIGQANFEEILYVIEKKDDWAQVVLPKSVSLWVYSKLIEKKDNETGIAKKDGVNVRVKPNIKHFAICQLFKDEEVEILGEKWEWYQIKPPKNTVGWIHNNFIKQHMTLEEYEDYLREERISQLFKDAESIHITELAKGTNIDYDYLLAIYKNIIDNYPQHPKGLIANEHYQLLLSKKASSEAVKKEELKNLPKQDRILPLKKGRR